MKHMKIVVTLVLFSMLSACIDLAHVNTFSATAVKILQSYSTINYSFTSSYYDFTAGEKLLPYNAKEAESNVFSVTSITTDTALLHLNEKADQTISYFVDCLSAYFQAISKISGKDLVNINFDGLAKNFKASDKVKAKLGINDQQIDASSKIAKTVVNRITGSYRQKKLKKVLKDEDADLITSIDALVFSLTALQINLRADSGLIQSNYNQVLSDVNIKETSQKIIWKTKYFQSLADLRTERSKIQLLIAGLGKIREGHHKVVLEAGNSKLNSSKVISLLDEYTSEAFNVFEQIKLINKQSKN